MDSKTVSVADAASCLLDLLGQVESQGKSFDIVDGSRVVARLSPAAQAQGAALSKLNLVLQSLPQLDRNQAEAFAHEVKARLRALRTDVGD